MSEGVTYKRLGEIAIVHDSLRKPVTKSDRKAGIYPYYGATGVQDYVDQYIFDGRYVLVGEDGAKWGANDKSAYIIEGKSWVNNHAHVLSFNDDICDSYVTYFLNFADLDKFISGAIVRKLTQKSLLEISIPVPSLSTQELIVRELDSISSVISAKKQQVLELDNLAQAIFLDTFGDPITNPKGWEVKKMSEVGLVKIGPFGSLLHKSDYVSGGIPLVNPVHMKGGYIQADMDFTITTDKAKELSNYRMQPNDFVFARRGDIGRCAIVSAEQDGYLCGTGSLFVRLTDAVNSTFMLYVTRSKSFVSCLNDKAKGATMQNINCGIVENLPIPLPPLSLQQAFAEKVQAIEEQKRLINQSIAEFESLLAQRMEFHFA